MLIKSNSLIPLFKSVKIYLLNIEKNQLATFHLPIPKIIITIPENTKISDVKATFNNGAEVSYIILETAIRLSLPIIKNQSIALKTIIGIKSCFISYADNIAIIIRNLIICT